MLTESGSLSSAQRGRDSSLERQQRKANRARPAGHTHNVEGAPDGCGELDTGEFATGELARVGFARIWVSVVVKHHK